MQSPLPVCSFLNWSLKLAFTFNEVAVGIVWLLIGGFISFLPFHSAQLIDAECLNTNKRAAGVGETQVVQVVQMQMTGAVAPGNASEGGSTGATTQPGV